MTGRGGYFLLGFVAALILGVTWDRLRASRANAARDAQEQRLAEQAESLQAARRDLEAARTRARSLALDSARVYRLWSIDREAAAAGVTAVEELARQARARGDTAAARTLEGAATATELELTACSLVTANCEARAANATGAWQRAEAQLNATAAQLDTTKALWRDAERRAQPSFFRDVWRSRAVTLPLILTTVLVVVVKK